MGDGTALIGAIEAAPDDTAARLAYADWLQEQGDETGACVVRAHATHGLPFVARPTAVRDVTLEKLANDYDWKEVFGQGSGGNCERKADACPPGAPVDLTPPDIAEVAEVIAASNGEGDEAHWVGLFRMRDGRFVVADAWCDYTGWD